MLSLLIDPVRAIRLNRSEQLLHLLLLLK